MTISERIADLLKRSKLTQKAMAEYLSVTPSTVNTWIKQNADSIPSSYIMPLCKYFSVTPEELLTGINEDHINVTADELKLLTRYRNADDDTKILIISDVIRETRAAK